MMPPIPLFTRRAGAGMAADVLAPTSLVLFVLLASAGLYWWHSAAMDARDATVAQAAMNRANLACKTDEAARQKALITQTGETLARGQAVAQVAQKKAQNIDEFFSKLERQADATKSQNPGAAVCSLSPERLRIWQAANAGADSGGGASRASAREPDGQASPVAPAQERSAARFGGQPSGGGEGLSPVGEPLLPAAGVFTGAPLR